MVVDAGHGGDDGGCRGAGGTAEKDIALLMAQSLRGTFRDEPSVRVVLTREDDRAVSLSDRAALANRNHASVYVSFHCATSLRAGDSGFLVYCFRTQDSSRTVREKVGDRDVRLLPWEFVQSEYAAPGRELAGSLINHLLGVAVPAFPSPLAEPLKPLASVDCPAVLVECVHLSNRDEEKGFLQPDRRDAFCRRVKEALLDFLRSGRSNW